MKLPFKKKVGRVVLISLAGFLVLFLFRFIYGYTTGASEVGEEYISDFFSEREDLKHNYASDKYRYKSVAMADAVSSAPSAQAPAPAQHEFNVDQKYEKTATIKSRSGSFDDDEKTLRSKIKSYNAIIQYEENSGKKGDRELHLMIGIPPEKFDTFYVDVLKIGRIKSKEITKIDKTNEFKNLNARKASLESMRQSLFDIKRQSGRIEEYVNLQNRILEVEQELQNLGVSLGDFDEENEFCTVRFSLVESFDVKISMLHRIKVAFEWAITNFLLVICIVGAAAFFGFFLLLIIDKVLPSIINRVNQP
jgi:hypothetical protein